MSNLIRHKIFHNPNLDYNKISFLLKIKVSKNEKKEIELIFKSMKKDNIEIIKESPFIGIIKKLDVCLPEIVNKRKNVFDRKHSELINQSFETMKKECSEIINILKLYLIKVEEIDYKENYYILNK